ncbi:hypothetical protein [Pseudoxanthomonas mexicana]|jgi:hypothetical protein
MNVLKTGFFVAVAALAVLAAREYVPRDAVQALTTRVTGGPADAASAASRHGFVDIPLPDGQSGHHVVIFAPANCPSDAAQRAEALARRLDDAGIPYTRSQSANFSTLSSQDDANRVMSVMNGPIPVVFVRKRARANPDAEAVVAEYRGG